MKRLIIVFICLSFFFIRDIAAQSSKYSCTEISDIDGHLLSLSSLLPSKSDAHLIMFFWKMDDMQSGITLSDFTEHFHDSIDTQNNRIVLIVVDHNGNNLPVKTWKYGKDIDMEVYIDRNGSAKSQFGISNTPQLILVDSDGRILWQQICFQYTEASFIIEQIRNFESIKQEL